MAEAPIGLAMGSLTLRLPSSFELQSAIVLAPVEPSAPHRSSINVIRTERPVPPAGLEQYVDEQIRGLSKLRAFKVLRRESPTFARGRAILLKHRFEDEGLAIAQLQLYVATEGESFVVTATTPEAELDRRETMYQQILLSPLQ
jgi:hypothetical protein